MRAEGARLPWGVKAVAETVRQNSTSLVIGIVALLLSMLSSALIVGSKVGTLDTRIMDNLSERNRVWVEFDKKIDDLHERIHRLEEAQVPNTIVTGDLKTDFGRLEVEVRAARDAIVEMKIALINIQDILIERFRDTAVVPKRTGR